MLTVRGSHGKGKGVFTLKRFSKDEVIEEAPVIIMPNSQKEDIEKTEIRDYYWEWDENSMALAFGYVSMCNHSYSPNAVFKKNLKDSTISLIALRDIEVDEEITTNYNGPPDDSDPVWFEVK